MSERVIVLIDMDCFYCQVEARYNPSLKGKPMAVVQYNQWQGGGIIAVNYEARVFGVTRHIRGNEAKKKCPDIILVHVPSIRGKADLTRYRDAGKEVVAVLCSFCDTVQRASVDEAYLDITNAVNTRQKELSGCSLKPEQLPNTFIVGWSPEDNNDEDERSNSLSLWLDSVYKDELQNETSEKLAIAALIVEEMRKAVFEVTGFQCSAGIAHNKILAKLACGLHKPQRQTVLPQASVPILYHTLPLKKVRGLGGKFGDLVMEHLCVNTMGDLLKFSEGQLQKAFDEKSGSWLYNIAHGLDDEPVISRLKSKSIGCCKKFPGKLALGTREMVEHWVRELAEEVSERLEKESDESGRRATQIVVSYMQTIDGCDVSSSRCGTLSSHDLEKLFTDAMELLKRSNSVSAGNPGWIPPLKFLGISAGKFVEKTGKTSTIQDFFKSATKSLCSNQNESGKQVDDKGSSENATAEFRQGAAIGQSEKIEKIGKQGMMEKQDCATNETPNKSDKRSFFLNFFKEEGLVKTPKSSKKKRLTPRNKTHKFQKGYEVRRGPTGTSQEAGTSWMGLETAGQKLPASGRPCDSCSQEEEWVSPREIFPDLNNVDESVAALLPSPLQRLLQSRLENHRAALKVECEEKKNRHERGKSKRSLTTKFAMLSDNCALEQESRKSAEHFAKSDNDNTANISQDIFASDTSLQVEDNKSDIDVEIEKAETSVGFLEKNDTSSKGEYDSNIERQQLLQTIECCENCGDNKDPIEAGCVQEVCPHCQQEIPLQDFPEHLDFHVAADLDRQLNEGLDTGSAPTMHRVNTSPRKESPKKDVQGKRKRDKLGQKQKQPLSTTDKKMRSITSFFAPVR